MLTLVVQKIRRPEEPGLSGLPNGNSTTSRAPVPFLLLLTPHPVEQALGWISAGAACL
jgi:hypothetical protein